MDIAGEVTGKVYKRYNTVEYYFKLKKTNDSLVKANERLYNQLKQDFQMPDTVIKVALDSSRLDSVTKFRRFQYLAAKVRDNSVNLPNNYLVLERGSKQGVKKDLGVIDINNAVVGTVINVSPNYSVVMSLLHTQSNINGKLKKTGETGSVIWDTKDPRYIILKDIKKGINVSVGDSVLTSGHSEKFPFGKLIGTVQEVINEKSTSNYIIRLKTAADFYNLEFVYIIDDLQKDEPQELLKMARKTHE